MRIDFQKLRHGRAARLGRRMLYAALVGREGWPPTFRAPRGPDDVPRSTSSNLYVHLPFCRKICPHCPYNEVPYDRAAHRAYGAALDRELHAYLAATEVPPIRTLYFGGGTPTVTPDLVESAIATLRSRLSDGAAVAVEVHPDDATPAMLSRLRRAGVSRISLGIETFDPDLLRMLGRRYAPEEAADAVRSARGAGFECVDVNLIYGMPGQTVAGSIRDAQRCLDLEVDQISAYPLFTFLHTHHGRRVAERRMPIPDDRTRTKAQREISALCRGAGLERTSVWSYTRSGVAPDSTVTREDYVGFGAGAGSKVGGVFWFNTFSVPAYSAAEIHRPALVLQVSERFRRFHWLYWQIYGTYVDARRYRELFARDLAADHGRLLWLLRFLGFARKTPEGIRLTERGATWSHRLQCLYSLTYIDELWTRCQREARPDEVVLV